MQSISRLAPKSITNPSDSCEDEDSLHAVRVGKEGTRTPVR
jgi:hypothetical protein